MACRVLLITTLNLFDVIFLVISLCNSLISYKDVEMAILPDQILKTLCSYNATYNSSHATIKYFREEINICFSSKKRIKYYFFVSAFS